MSYRGGMSGNPWDTSGSRGSIPTTSSDVQTSLRSSAGHQSFTPSTTQQPRFNLNGRSGSGQISSFPYQATSSGSSSFAAPAFSPREAFPSNYPGSFASPSRPGSVWTNDYSTSSGSHPASSGMMYSQWGSDKERRSSPETYLWEDDYSTWTGSDYHTEGRDSRMVPNDPRGKGKGYNQRKPSNRDEFDGPHQLLDKPSPGTIAAQERDLPHLATNLLVHEQDEILTGVNDRLSKCAYDFVAKYQFPIPLESDKRLVKNPNDREWTEWVYLLKRLATKRRIPARVLYNGQIKQLITVLENSLEMRHAAKHQSRPLKDDRNVLQLISAGIQVAKILKDASAMEYLDHIYIQTEQRIQVRKINPPGYLA